MLFFSLKRKATVLWCGVSIKESEEDSGFIAGFKLGQLSREGSWDVRFNYREVEADAVFGAYTFADFAGGATDGSGVEIGANYQIHDHAIFNFSLFLNEKNVSTTKDEFTHLQLELTITF